MSLPIYLDYASTTPVDPRVAETMARYLTLDGAFGNPASRTHVFGQTAKQAVEKAREQVAALVNAEPRDIVWTSGATEANNLALKGATQSYQKRGRHIVTSKTEHKAVLDTCRWLERQGFTITYLDPDSNGIIDPAQVATALRDDTVLVSIMHVNNETGVVQDLMAIGALTRERRVLFHVDAAQSNGKLPIDLKTLNVDLMSFSAHKIYGPKGIGALYVCHRPRVRLAAQLHGGGHEGGLRAGTLATHQIVAMGEAFRIANSEMNTEHERIQTHQDKLWKGLQDLEEINLNGHLDKRVAGILNLSFSGVKNESLIVALNEQLAISAGSACTSAQPETSHVLQAMGHPKWLAESAIRFSIGRFTTTAEIDHTIEVVRAAVNKLRSLSPLWELHQQGLDWPQMKWIY